MITNKNRTNNDNLSKEEGVSTEPFDYKTAMSELEEIVKKIEDPEFSLDDIDKYVKRSKYLITGCRNYLRNVREKIDQIEDI